MEIRQSLLSNEHTRNLGSRRGGPNAPPIFLLPKISFFGYYVEKGQIRSWGESGGKGCTYIKD